MRPVTTMVVPLLPSNATGAPLASVTEMELIPLPDGSMMPKVAVGPASTISVSSSGVMKIEERLWNTDKEAPRIVHHVSGVIGNMKRIAIRSVRESPTLTLPKEFARNRIVVALHGIQSHTGIVDDLQTLRTNKNPRRHYNSAGCY